MNADLLKTRIKKHNTAINDAGECILYVMSRDQRVRDNHALLAAQKHALALQKPLAVVFCLTKVKGRAREHYDFMLKGLQQVETDLKARNIPFMMVIGTPIETLTAVMHHTKPAAVYFDFNPLRGPRKVQDTIATHAQCAVYVVDTHNIVPTWVLSSKREVGAYTLRPKLHKILSTYLVEPENVVVHPYTWPGTIQTISMLQSRIDSLLATIPHNGTHIKWVAGEKAAAIHLDTFINDTLNDFGQKRNTPSVNAQSNLSPYIHFGQISALRVALLLADVTTKNGYDIHLIKSPKMPKPEDTNNTLQYSIDALIEELVVRKELADNFCFYCPDYDNINAAADWAKNSLNKHKADKREYIYSYDQLVNAQTHDDIWNMAQQQMTTTGKMHGYLRMYWAKKVLEWSESPEQAIEYLVKMNDFYSIDGGDPNGYAGILWSVAGVHDRPWFDRSVFGLIRYMGYESIKKKYFYLA